jgi:hypothetical protein
MGQRWECHPSVCRGRLGDYLVWSHGQKVAENGASRHSSELLPARQGATQKRALRATPSRLRSTKGLRESDRA